MRVSWLARFLFVVAAAAAVVLPSTAALAKSAVPYTDSRSTGSIALCNAAGQDITHGSVYDKPFAYRVVSSVPAPIQYRGTGRRATLYAFQPREGVDPSQWNGDSLTATSTYTNPLVPMAEGSKTGHRLVGLPRRVPGGVEGARPAQAFPKRAERRCRQHGVSDRDHSGLRYDLDVARSCSGVLHGRPGNDA